MMQTGVRWVDVDTRKPEELATLSDVFHFHPLAIEDCLNPKSRVKIDEYDGYVFIIIRAVAFCEETEDPYDIETVNICFFLGKDYLVTVHSGDAPIIESFKKRFARNPDMNSYTPARLLHAILDEVIDAFFPIIDRLDEFMDTLEDRVFTTFDQNAIHDVFSVKRLVVALRRHLAPQRDVFTVMANRPSAYLPPETQIYFRDTYDHVLRINDGLESFRELLSSTMDSYLTQVSNRLGTVSKTLGIFATISIPFVVISGMWGMNVPVPLADNPSAFWDLVIMQLAFGLVIWGVLRWRRLL